MDCEYCGSYILEDEVSYNKTVGASTEGPEGELIEELMCTGSACCSSCGNHTNRSVTLDYNTERVDYEYYVSRGGYDPGGADIT